VTPAGQRGIQNGGNVAIRRYRELRPYVVYSERLPTRAELLMLVVLGWGLWLENGGGIPGDFPDRLPVIARRIRGLVYMGAGLKSITALENFRGLRTLSLELALREAADLRDLRHLRRLHLGGMGLSKVKNAVNQPRLRDVFLEGADGAHLAALGSDLRRLGLRKLTVGRIELAPKPHLRDLVIGSTPEVDIAGIASSTSIRTIEIDRVRSVTGFAFLAELPQLRALWTENIVKVDAPEVIDALPLQCLNVQGTSPFSDEQLRAYDARGVAGNRMRQPRSRA
jgi:hypothetical protein